jgi:hypothetical protein
MRRALFSLALMRRSPCPSVQRKMSCTSRHQPNPRYRWIMKSTALERISFSFLSPGGLGVPTRRGLRRVDQRTDDKQGQPRGKTLHPDDEPDQAQPLIHAG